MNVTELLQDSLSPDREKRENATKVLQDAARDNWPAYMGVLSQELVKDESPAHIRLAAGTALKNALTAKDITTRAESQGKWVALNPESKKTIKNNALATLNTQDAQTRIGAANFIASIAAIEIPRDEWPDLITGLVESIQNPQASKSRKVAAFKTIEYIAEIVDPDYLIKVSNAILNAVVVGTQQDQADDDIRIAAIECLYSSLSFVRENMEREGERNFIMQVICEATQHANARVQVPAFSSLVRVMQLYYDKMQYYMEKALFGLTVLGMRSPNTDVATQAIEFWSTVCEEELDINEEIQEARELNEQPDRRNSNFAKIAMNEVIPQILSLLYRQDDDEEGDEWTVANSAASAISLFAQITQETILAPVLHFVEENIRSESWSHREASVMAFASVMDGPEPNILEPLIQQALPVLISMLADPNAAVRDSTSYALFKATEMCPSAFTEQTLQPLLEASAGILGDSRNATVQNSAAIIQNLALQHGVSKLTDPTTALRPYYEPLVTELMKVTQRTDPEYVGARNAAWEAICKLTEKVGIDSIPIVSNLTTVSLDRLEQSYQQRAQAVSVEDRMIVEETQVQLCAVLNSCIRRIGAEARPVATRMMTILIQLLQQVRPNDNPAYEDILYAVGTLANCVLESDFNIYVTALFPYLYAALDCHDQPGLLSASLGTIADVIRAVGENIQSHCDTLMQYLLRDLQDTRVAKNVKPAILSLFGDLALAITGAFETYLPISMQLLQQASQHGTAQETSYGEVDYIDSLREGILEAYAGIILGLKAAGKVNLLMPYIQPLFGFLSVLHGDDQKSEDTLKSMCGILGDTAEAFPNKELRDYFKEDWVMECLKSARSRSGFSPDTRATAKWAREMVRLQLSV